MPFLLLLPLIIVPIAEIAVFIQVGHLIGLWPTLLGILLTAVIGMALVRRQGLDTLARARAAMDRRQVPVLELFDGVCIVVGGILLLTPGFLTDTIGLLLLLPAVRAIIRGYALRRLRVDGAPATSGPSNGRGRIIDVDFEEMPPSPPPALPPEDRR